MAGGILLGDLCLCEISFVETPSHVPKRKYVYFFFKKKYVYFFKKRK